MGLTRLTIKFFLRFVKVWRPESHDVWSPESSNVANDGTTQVFGRTHRIPYGNSRGSISGTVRVRSRCDGDKAHEAVAVRPGVEEAERCLAVRNEVVMGQLDNADCNLYVGGQLGARG